MLLLPIQSFFIPHCKKSVCFFLALGLTRSTFPPFSPLIILSISSSTFISQQISSFSFFLPLTDYDSLYNKSVSMVVISTKNKNNVKLITITISTNCENNHKICYVCSILHYLRLKGMLSCSCLIHMIIEICLFGFDLFSIFF